MRRLLTLLLFLSAGLPTMSQGLKGLIVSRQTGETIIGAVIKAEGTPYYAVSGLDGSFNIKYIPKGQYKITISMISFITETRNVTIGDTPTLLSTIQLKTDQKELSNVTVTATRDKNNDAQARNLERTANQVMNVVSARAIEISPDLTVANVIQRVSGITVERNATGDGQYALIRGMDKRFNYTLVNGVKIPSPDNKNRFVPLDIFPAELLDRLEVYKSLTPEMEGDGIGGAINLVMKNAPNRLLVSGNVASGSNTLFFDRPFYTYNKSLIQSKSPYEILGPAYPAQPRDFNSGLLDVRKMGTKPNLYAGLSLGNRFFDGKLGVLVAGTYQNSLRGNNSTYFSFGTTSSSSSNLPVLSSSSNRTYSEEQTRAGVHAKLDYRISVNHKLQLYSAFLNFENYQVRDDRKIDLAVSYDPEHSSYKVNYSTRLRYTQQQIQNNTLNGEHNFLDNKFSIDWSAVYSKATNEVPENSQVHLATSVVNGVENPKAVVALGGAERRWEHNTDEDKAGYLNFKYKWGKEDMPVVISAGGLYRDKKRNNFFNEYQFRPEDLSKTTEQNNLIEGRDWNSYSGIKFNVFNPTGSPGDPLNYSATEKIGAGYLQGKLASAKFEIVAGARIENTDQGFVLNNPVAGVQGVGSQKYTDVLPSANLKFKLNEKTNLRASYYKAINRPSFYEIVPYKGNTPEEVPEAGNPDLLHTVAQNVDVRYELFPKQSEQLLIGAFYKSIANPIETGIITQGQSTFYTPTNFGTATNYGLELDYTKYIHSFGVKLNYTYTHSNITTDKQERYDNPDPTATDKIKVRNVDQKRPLSGQAAHVANFTLLYKNLNKGIDGQLSLGYTGDRLSAVSQYINNDIWQSGFVQLDASAEKKIGRRFVVFAKATNLLNTPLKEYVKAINTANEKAIGYQTSGNNTITRNDKYGQTILAGIRFKY